MEMTSASVPDQIGLHHDDPEDNPSTPYPPPTYIDFASGDLRPPHPPTHRSALSFRCQWLGEPHDGYPLATTLDEYVQLRQSAGARSPREHLALMQSQLTFGLLEAVLCVKIPEAVLLAQASPTDGTTTVLSTDNLPILCRDWYHRIRVRHRPDKCKAWLKNAYAALFEAGGRLWELRELRVTNPFLAAGLDQEASEHIIRVLSMIGLSLQVARMSVPSQCGSNQTRNDAKFSHLPRMEHARDQLRAEGWCPLTIAALEIDGFVMVEYARSFRPFLRRAGEHNQCTRTSCTVNNIDPTAYIQRHFSNDCNCAPIIPPIHAVHSLLSAGRVPVVTVTDQGVTVRASGDAPYVAISHVWIDGMGSTTEEGLPACQIARIATMASCLIPGGAFWIDALCVPGKKDLRKRAIQLMAKTYADAAAILVIDAGIRSCSIDAPLEEKLLRIYTSGWMHRLWTYQEGMLARRLSFEFADGVLGDLEDLVPSYERVATSPLLFLLSPPLWNIRSYMSRRAGSESGRSSLPIGTIANALGWRTTSRAEDETLAIAGLLQIDIRELLDAPSADERMKILLLQKRTLPPKIIFGTAPKISGIPGFSWARRSLMSGLHLGVWAGEESAICTPTGLLAEYAALIFSEPVELDEDRPYVICDTNRPAICSFVLQPIKLGRNARQESCNAVLVQQDISTAVGSAWRCVAVRMVDVEEGMFDGREQVCQYRDIHFVLEVIEVPRRSQWRVSGTPVIDAEWIPRIKVKVI